MSLHSKRARTVHLTYDRISFVERKPSISSNRARRRILRESEQGRAATLLTVPEHLTHR